MGIYKKTAPKRLSRSSSFNAKAWSDLPQRLTTICVGIPILYKIWFHAQTRYSFFQGVHAIMCWEWSQLSHCSSDMTLYFMIVSIILCNLADPTLFLTLFVFCTTVLVNDDAILTGLLLVTVPCRSWLIVQTDFYRVVSLLLTVWNGDTGALIAGRLAAEYHLPVIISSPDWLRRISPNKSVIGILGGILSATLTYQSLPYLWKYAHRFGLTPAEDGDLPLFVPSSPLWIGISLSLCAVAGDLWESALKRKYGAKDAGSLLPGHGGVLDRFDSSLLAVMLYQLLIEKGFV